MGPQITSHFGLGTSSQPFDLTTESEPDLTQSSPRHDVANNIVPRLLSRRSMPGRRVVSTPARIQKSQVPDAILEQPQASRAERPRVSIRSTTSTRAVEHPDYVSIIPADSIGAFPSDTEPLQDDSELPTSPLMTTPPSRGANLSSATFIPHGTSSAGRNTGGQSSPRAPPALHDIIVKTAINIHRDLRRLFMDSLAPKDAQGIVYVISDPNRPGLGFKVGSTAVEDYTKRFKGYESKCGFKPFEIYRTDTVDYCRRLERLIQHDLAEYNRRWVCTHPSPQTGTKLGTHREWFAEDSAQLVIDTVKKWENFFRLQKPYDERDRRLNTVWTHIMARRRLETSPDIELSHEARREQWATFFAPPTIADYVGAHLKAFIVNLLGVFEHLRIFWRSWVGSLPVLVMCGRWPNSFTFGCLWVVLAHACFTHRSHSPMGRARKQS